MGWNGKAAALTDLKGAESIHLCVVVLPAYRIKEKRAELRSVKLNCSSGEQERETIYNQMHLWIFGFVLFF